jgi:hypothetical protein
MNLRQNSHLTGTQLLNTSNCHHFEISDLPSIRGSALAVAVDWRQNSTPKCNSPEWRKVADDGAYRHLEIRERAVIEMQLELGTRPGVIARYLNRSRSTITRELHRNGWQSRGVLPRSGPKMPTGGYHCESDEGVPIDWLVAHACEAQAGTGL